MSPTLACKITLPSGDSSEIFCSNGLAWIVPTNSYVSSSLSSSSKNLTVINLPRFDFSSFLFIPWISYIL